MKVCAGARAHSRGSAGARKYTKIHIWIRGAREGEREGAVSLDLHLVAVYARQCVFVREQPLEFLEHPFSTTKYQGRVKNRRCALDAALWHCAHPLHGARRVLHALCCMAAVVNTLVPLAVVCRMYAGVTRHSSHDACRTRMHEAYLERGAAHRQQDHRPCRTPSAPRRSSTRTP